MKPEAIKQALNDAIQAIIDYKWLYSVRPGKDNTRSRKFPFSKMISSILAFRGGTLNREIKDFFGLDPNIGTSSAFMVNVVNLMTLKSGFYGLFCSQQPSRQISFAFEYEKRDGVDMKHYIGIDLGTSAVKLLLMDAAGKIENTVTKEWRTTPIIWKRVTSTA